MADDLCLFMDAYAMDPNGAYHTVHRFKLKK